jgi:hypothetical protein
MYTHEDKEKSWYFSKPLITAEESEAPVLIQKKIHDVSDRPCHRSFGVKTPSANDLRHFNVL